jgi:hypothetical protein
MRATTASEGSRRAACGKPFGFSSAELEVQGYRARVRYLLATLGLSFNEIAPLDGANRLLLAIAEACSPEESSPPA